MQSYNWFALQVYVGKEKWVTTTLEERGHETLLLVYDSVQQWSDRRVTIDRAVFPGYVFCRLGLERRGRILGIPGVLRIVGAGRQPLPLNDSEIFSLMRIADAGYSVSPAPHFCSGDPVVIRGGSLDGVRGRLIRYRTGVRVIVSVSLLERAVSLEVDVNRLERVHSTVTNGAQTEFQETLEPALPVRRYGVPSLKAALVAATTAR